MSIQFLFLLFETNNIPSLRNNRVPCVTFHWLPEKCPWSSENFLGNRHLKDTYLWILSRGDEGDISHILSFHKHQMIVTTLKAVVDEVQQTIGPLHAKQLLTLHYLKQRKNIRINKSDSRTEHCGTPHSFSHTSDLSPCREQLWDKSISHGFHDLQLCTLYLAWLKCLRVQSIEKMHVAWCSMWDGFLTMSLRIPPESHTKCISSDVCLACFTCSNNNLMIFLYDM